MEAALSNPIILGTIISYLHPKEVRAVSRLWNKVTLSQRALVLRIRTQWHLRQFSVFCSGMNPNLARIISFSTQRGNHHVDKEDIDDLCCLMNACGNHVQEIRKMVLSQKWFSEMCKLLHNPQNFRSLKYLQVYVSDLFEEIEVSEEQLCGPIRPRRRLVSLNLGTAGDFRFAKNNLQNLLDSAINLEKLKITGDWLPNRLPNYNLTSFKFIGTTDWDTTKLSNILKQVANSLVHLYLDNCSYWNRKIDETVFLTIPSMPYLETFVNKKCNHFPITFVELSEQRMKKLEFLELGSLRVNSLENMLRNGSNNMTNMSVKKLALFGQVSDEMRIHCTNQFPNTC